MLNQCIIFLFLSYYFVRAQFSPGYTCVQMGKCQGTNGVGIDPRFLTKRGNPCPLGQMPCMLSFTQLYGTGTCGTRKVANDDSSYGAPTKGAWPWTAYIMNQTGFCGGGVLINPNTVLTAAHKVHGNRNTPNLIGVYMGVYNPAELGARLTVSQITIHPNFNMVTFFNDIALLQLSTPITPLPQTSVNTVCLPTVAMSFIGYSCTVSGWGQTKFTSNDAPSANQKQIHVKIVDYYTCHQSMSNLLGANVDLYLDPQGEICAGGEALRDSCTYDGGSPLVCHANSSHYVLAGLVIWGKGCGQPGHYGVYVSIPNYIPWIQSVTTI